MKRMVTALVTGLIGVVLGLGVGVIGWPVISKFLPDHRPDSNIQTVTSLTREEQIAFVSLGIQGLVSDSNRVKIVGVELPGTEKVTFLQYTYQAKLGIDGKQVRIEPTGPKSFRLHIPDFIFIGHDKEQFQVAVEKDGLVSWATPEVDKAQLITEILSDDTKQTHINNNRELLEQQARSFYEGIIHGVDPEIKLEFEFTRP